MNMEIRFQEMELTSNTDETLTVSGYVNKTQQPSNILGSDKKFIEKISKGAFQRAIDKSLNESRDIDFLAEHKSELILSSTRNNSLKLHEDDVGLFMEATITPTTWGKDYYKLIDSKIIQNMSFGFRSLKDEWRSLEPGLFERSIEELELYEVSAVKNPAYSQTSIAARGIDVIEEVEIPKEIREESESMEKIDDVLERLSAIESGLTNLESRLSELIDVLENKDVEQEEEEEIEEEVEQEENTQDESSSADNRDEDEEEDEEEEDERKSDTCDCGEKRDDDSQEDLKNSEPLNFSEYRKRLYTLK